MSTCDEVHPEHPEVHCEKPDPCYGYHLSISREDIPSWGNPVEPLREHTAAEMKEMAKGIKKPDRVGPPQPGHRQGITYDAEFDYARLNAQMRRVYDRIVDGNWWTLADLSEATGDPESSISARLRDLRKPKFGSRDVERERVGGVSGTWRYRLVQ